ncbi:hypothetical protein E2C01_097563 [Portunus trituberculatus]|uniref:Uncharacterized protein n=1 Tax=Portunus trituberculatus TaxID=210409 RepID=A0A5B7KA95_PORTR|nr:hypothetical protein [Portunus trituberculatus]
MVLKGLKRFSPMETNNLFSFYINLSTIEHLRHSEIMTICTYVNLFLLLLLSCILLSTLLSLLLVFFLCLWASVVSSCGKLCALCIPAI